MKWVRSITKTVLRFFHSKLVYVPKGNVWGNDLEADLATVVGRGDPVCIDVGANEGQTIRLFQSIFSAATIEAFEPSNECFARLAAENWGPGVTCHHAGVGACAENLQFRNYDASTLSSFLDLDRNSSNPFREASVKAIHEVQVVTIDEFLETRPLARVDVLKIDTQGFDFEVLKGSEKSLNSGIVRCILIELNFIGLYKNQGDACEILSWLLARGFKIVDLYEKNRVHNGLQWCTALFVRDEAI